MSQSIVPWNAFVSFIKDEDMWSRWSMLFDPRSESYFDQALRCIDEQKSHPHFDFSKVNDVSVVSRGGDTINWEHDGESLFHFFKIWAEGKRV